MGRQGANNVEETPETQEPNVITVTLSPSLDRTLITHYLAVGYHNRTEESTRLDPAGQGVDIARALHSLVRRAHALVLIGDDPTGRSYQALLAAERFEHTVIRVHGRTPSNTIILDTGNRHETQILEEREEISRDDLVEVAHRLKQLVQPGDLVVFAGPLPPGVSDDTYAWLVDLAQEAGAKVGLVTSGEALREALPAGPELVAVSRLQMEAFFNYPVRTRAAVLESARSLVEMGARMVLVEIRRDGEAFLVNEEGCWHANLVLDEETGTTSGVWDAFVGGFLAGRMSEMSPPEALELAAATGTYAGAHIGHEFGSYQEVREVLEQVQVTPCDELEPEVLNQASEVRDAGAPSVPQGSTG